jgi:hypothetical protein
MIEFPFLSGDFRRRYLVASVTGNHRRTRMKEVFNRFTPAGEKEARLAGLAALHREFFVSILDIEEAGLDSSLLLPSMGP